MPSCNVTLPSACSMITGSWVAFSIAHRGGGVGLSGESHSLGIGRRIAVGNGVEGYSDQGIGVFGSSDQGGSGVAGRADNGGDGVYGESYSGGNGVHGYSESKAGYGVWGENDNTAGVVGYSQNDGVSGVCSGGGFGVTAFGEGPGAGGLYASSKTGVAVSADAPVGPALVASSQGPTTAILYGGDTEIGSNLNVAFTTHTKDAEVEESLQVKGQAYIVTLLSPLKFFRIDHPLDPANKYLLHASVESSERKNLYDGVVRLDRKGEAVVQLPKWFEALNKDIRYQLCALGGPSPNLHLRRELKNGRFQIAGGRPQQRVCWQITGVRQDAMARRHPMRVEENKPVAERGLYQNPEAHGKPAAKGIGYRRASARRQALQSAEKLVRGLRAPTRPRKHKPVFRKLTAVSRRSAGGSKK